MPNLKDKLAGLSPRRKTAEPMSEQEVDQQRKRKESGSSNGCGEITPGPEEESNEVSKKPSLKQLVKKSSRKFRKRLDSLAETVDIEVGGRFVDAEETSSETIESWRRAKTTSSSSIHQLPGKPHASMTTSPSSSYDPQSPAKSPNSITKSPSSSVGPISPGKSPKSILKNWGSLSGQQSPSEAHVSTTDLLPRERSPAQPNVQRPPRPAPERRQTDDSIRPSIQPSSLDGGAISAVAALGSESKHVSFDRELPQPTRTRRATNEELVGLGIKSSATNQQVISNMAASGIILGNEADRYLGKRKHFKDQLFFDAR